MRTIFKISIPPEPFNTLAREGVVGQKIGRIIEETKPETIYFTGNRYGRGVLAVYDIQNGSAFPAVAEPWFLTFNAEIEYDAAFTPEEMMEADLDEVVKKWA